MATAKAAGRSTETARRSVTRTDGLAETKTEARTDRKRIETRTRSGTETETETSVMQPAAAPAAMYAKCKVSAGGNHTCMVRGGGGVVCWGANRVGQLGRDDTTSVGNTAGSGVREGTANVSLPMAASCVCAGGGYIFGPDADESYTCVLLVNGSVMCWGANDFGQLGQGDTVERGGAPGSMSGLRVIPLSEGAMAVTCGALHVCVLTIGSGTRCWGYNGYGQVRA
jgi:alpha-tubulin suppressor-like RCC1 family protein